jgi:hypothetical protein
MSPRHTLAAHVPGIIVAAFEDANICTHAHARIYQKHVQTHLQNLLYTMRSHMELVLSPPDDAINQLPHTQLIRGGGGLVTVQSDEKRSDHSPGAV